ncbi:coilin isoform X1 [Ziziphus jujuba]|uniref:Coilin isoform X1 n=1 Tax=Ziziphus jujuba TaxID=326968 RepID=A0ABM3I2E3_ZIZJJ|nr:coilin isoform X1 [Ziziphus jujuba]
MTTESMRVRLVFENRSILSESQRSEGLKRSWILIKPELEAISDLIDFILRVFDLHDACPNGLVLSMDGFVLPPFESICILKDKDIVRVKRKQSVSDDIFTLRNGNKTLELERIPDNTPIKAGMKLLANEEFEKETGGYQSETEEDIPDQLEETLHADGTPDKKKVSKKRKASKMRQSSKRKRSKFSAAEESSDAPEEPNGIEAEPNESLQNCSSLPGKISAQKDKSAESEADESSNPDVYGKKCAVLSNMPDGTKKLASRSARRKKAKRRWLREEAKKKELEQRQILLTDNQRSSVKDNHKCDEEHQHPNRCNDEDDDIVPVVIRPGHIRFEPFSQVDSDQAIQEHQTLVWNGITNKKKGQKWGKEKSPYSKRSDRKNLNGESSEIPTIEEEALETFQWNGITNKQKGQKWGKEKSPYDKRSDNKNLNGESSGMPTIEEEAPVNVPIDFDKLKPCTSLPKVGDQVAYRLIELSSSWTPELSSFRVGTVSSYDAESNRISLLKVPEYPIVFEEIDESSAVQPSLYGEDGSLEIDYSSLVDVRIVKHGNLNSPKAVTDGVSEVTEGDQTSAWGLWPKKNGETQAPTQENGKKISGWDEISEALNAKKAQLSQVDHWNETEGSGRSPWSNRALRGSALGPTMARLRCQNGL